MRKTAAILFLLILFFNWIGYRFVFTVAENAHAQQMLSRLDESKYDDADLIPIKTFYPLPYLTNSAGFERWDGEINIDGILYKYVKRRFINDSIEFLCLPDYTSMQLQSAKENFFRLANDLQQNNGHSKESEQPVPVYKNILGQFCEELRETDFNIAAVELHHYSLYSFSHARFDADTPTQPPDEAG